MLKYLREQEAWDQFVLDSLGQNAVLVSVSRFSSDCRVYRTNDAIFKIRRLTPASMRGRNNFFEDEYLIMQRLSSVTGAFPQSEVISAGENGSYWKWSCCQNYVALI